MRGRCASPGASGCSHSASTRAKAALRANVGSRLPPRRTRRETSRRLAPEEFCLRPEGGASRRRANADALPGLRARAPPGVRVGRNGRVLGGAHHGRCETPRFRPDHQRSRGRPELAQLLAKWQPALRSGYDRGCVIDTTPGDIQTSVAKPESLEPSARALPALVSRCVRAIAVVPARRRLCPTAVVVPSRDRADIVTASHLVQQRRLVLQRGCSRRRAATPWLRPPWPRHWWSGHGRAWRRGIPGW